MKLQEKTSIILMILLITILVLISIFVSVVSMSSYSALEHKYLLQDVGQALNRLQDDYTSLSSIVADWGPWDDTYNFVNGKYRITYPQTFSRKPTGTWGSTSLS